MTRFPRLVARVLAVTAGSVVATAGAVAAAPLPTASPPASFVCPFPRGVPANTWQRLPRPAGATDPVSIAVDDQDACKVRAADGAGRRWRSFDAGAHWAAETATDAPVHRLVSEGLRPRAGAKVVGTTFGVGAVSEDTFPQVYVENGTFQPAAVAVGAQTPLGSVEQTQPLRMDVAAAMTAVHYTKGVAVPYVYLVGKAVTSLLPAAVSSPATTLLKSVDGGKTFRAVQAARQLTPTAIAVNPTSQDEIWVNDLQAGSGGGAWVSYDGGGSFASACCANASVYDVAVGAAPDGGIVVWLATDGGVKRSVDDGGTWETVSDVKASAIRTAPDDPGTVVVQTSSGVLLSTGPAVSFRPLPGLPDGCAPKHLRRTAEVPSTFLVECADGGTYRMLLAKYAGSTAKTGAGSGGAVGGLPIVGPTLSTARPLTELATWNLPDSNSVTGTIAFDGTVLYYDLNTPGGIGRVRASDGALLAPWRTDIPIVSMTVDLRRNMLLVTVVSGDLRGIDLTTGRMTKLGIAPTTVSTYDSALDKLSWVPEGNPTLYRRAVKGSGSGDVVCSGNMSTVSTFVASGDGGGYVQEEDDQTVLRVDKTCRVTGKFKHRAFSESWAENDAMACDTQSYFPQPAIWIRDSQPQTVTAYGVPFGYCPMPSRLDIEVPDPVYAGARTSICVRLTNATNGRPGVNRGIAVTVDGVVLGHGQTDADGRTCLDYVPPGGFVGRTQQRLGATFAGDSALYPSSTTDVLNVLDGQPVPPAPKQVAIVPPPPPPPVPAIPPNPVPNPGPGAAPVHGPAPQPAQAPQGQAQPNANPVAQGVVVPQRQQQVQLALAHAAQAIDLEHQAMVAPAHRRRAVPLDPSVAMALVGVGCLVTAVAARAQPAYARTRRRGVSP